jgi:hypothetical protein
MAPVYALNLFDLAPNNDYLAYQRNISKSVADYVGSKVIALGTLSPDADQTGGDTPPRQVMILVEWTSRTAFDAFLADPRRPASTACARTGPSATCGGCMTGLTTCARSSSPAQRTEGSIGRATRRLTRRPRS